MANAKKYILTGVTLGSIAAAAAGLIAATNLITKNQIAKNEVAKLEKGLVEIFEDSSSSILKDETIEKSFTDPDSKYNVKMSHFYSIENSESKAFLGYAVRCDGSNEYGKISLIAGFEPIELKFKSMYLIANEQSYASTLEKGYIDSVKKGGEYDTDSAVHCGATYGATLVRSMIRAAKSLVNEKGAKNV